MLQKKLATQNTTISEKLLLLQAFDNTLQSNIITITNSGKVIMANTAACRLLGYSKRELLTKNTAAIFDIREKDFEKMMGQRNADGRTSAYATAIRKNGKSFSCEITSAVFMDKDGIENAITTIADITQRKLEQKNIDTKKSKAVAHNILLAKSKQKKIDTRNHKIVAENISSARSKQKNIDTIKDKIVAGNIALAKYRQIKIDILKEKIVADNIILALAKADERLEKNNAWIKYIAKASYDVMWDWDIQTNEIYVGESVKEVFGYSVPKNNILHFQSFERCLLAEEKGRIQNKLSTVLASSKRTWSDSYNFRRRDGSVAFTDNRATIIRDDNAKAIRLIGATQDISRLRELEKKLENQIIIRDELNKIFIESSKLSFEAMWEWNLLTNKFALGKGFEKLFGYPLKNSKGNITQDWGNYLHPEDKKEVEKSLHAVIESGALRWEHGYRFIRANGMAASVFSRATIIRDAHGKACRMIGVMHDVSKIKRLEEKLKLELTLKKNQIIEAVEDARDSERSDIGKELHDNVNQLLGASKMYLELGKKVGENSLSYLNKSSEYTLSAIEEIRKLTRGLITDIIEELGLSEAIENISRDMMEVNPLTITCSLKSFAENSVDNKFKLNIFRIVQEHLNNILKHAKATKVSISLLKNKRMVKLSISDNGVGFDISKKGDGIGISNIKSRAMAYEGTAEFISQPGGGCVLSVSFPVME